MPLKKTTSIYRTNLVNVGIGQGQMEMLPYLFNQTEYNRKEEVIAQSSFTSDGLLAEKMAWEYDELGRIITQYYFSEPDEPSETISFERNEKGSVVKDQKKYIDGSVDTTTYLYDEKERLLEKITVDEDGISDQHEKFTWDDKFLVKHEVTDMEDNIISLDEYVYDSKGNIIEHRQVNEETGENHRIVSKFNDANQKIKDELFDDDDELLETSIYEIDQSGRLISSQFESPQKSSTTQYFYDGRGNPLGQEEIDEEENQILFVEHVYDDQNNRISSSIFSNGGTLSNNQHYELKYEYEWFDE
jgi:hypothetical protein